DRWGFLVLGDGPVAVICREDRADRQLLAAGDLGDLHAAVPGVVVLRVLQRDDAGALEPAGLDRVDDALPGQVLPGLLQRLNEEVADREAVGDVAVVLRSLGVAVDLLEQLGPGVAVI